MNLRINSIGAFFQQKGCQRVETNNTQGSSPAPNNEPLDDEGVFIKNSQDTATNQAPPEHWGLNLDKETYNKLKPLMDAYKNRYS